MFFRIKHVQSSTHGIHRLTAAHSWKQSYGVFELLQKNSVMVTAHMMHCDGPAGMSGKFKYAEFPELYN